MIPIIPPFFDWKQLLIVDAIETFTLAQNRVLKYKLPPNMLYLINLIQMQNQAGATQVSTFNTLKIDDVDLLSQAIAVTGISINGYTNGTHRIVQLSSFNAMTQPLILARKSIEMDIANSVLAGDLVIKVWAYVHQDQPKQFSVEANANTVTSG